jgi:hypothetical protein
MQLLVDPFLFDVMLDNAVKDYRAREGVCDSGGWKIYTQNSSEGDGGRERSHPWASASYCWGSACRSLHTLPIQDSSPDWWAAVQH